MRNTLILVGLIFFLIWDGLYNGGLYFDSFIRLLREGLAVIGLG